MVCRLGVVAALGGGCPQVGVVCLADVSLSALPRRWALSGVGNNYRTGGDARAGQGVNGQTRTPLTPAAVPAGAGEEGAAVLRRRDALGIVTPGVARERVEDNLAKMWQANLTEWYEENPDGDNLKKEKTPP
ncbi:hypothetical protein PAPYR_12192 [Paratrimastix pyriformis]|uniref:Uncharacterized protein n=1 Tax=Paratrimastix pyriformis TaxID=342808 RepID=A0ABQ8U4L4_9EUKA|nr:hypothetical protein PAPYR_12192 [Paratrimastix pyriformis]